MALTSGSARPNIIYIMADDLGYGDLGCYGARKIATPHIDRLASQGLRLTDAHSSSAVCTPSRYSVLTGRYCWRSRLKRWVLWGFEPPLIEPERLTLVSMLRAKGYATAAIGKWHLGLGWTTRDGADPLGDGSNVDYAVPVTGGPNARGFDHSFVLTGSLDMAPYCFLRDGGVVGNPSVEKHPYLPQQRKGLMVPDWQDDMVDVRFAEEAVAFIDRQAQREPDRPFFLYLTPSAPHRPCVPPPFMRGASQAGNRGDMVALVDWMVGQVDEALARNGLTDDTLIMITSDNGAQLTDVDGKDWGHRANGALRGQKADIWDGGHREPFIVRWPGRVAAGTASDVLVGLMDVMATCAEIVGYELPATAAPDSYSFLPVLLGQATVDRQVLVHHSGGGMFSVRQGDWKLVLGLGSGGFSEPVCAHANPGEPLGQLYNLRDDLAETTNLWDQYPEQVARLSAELARCYEQGYTRPGGQAS